MAFVHHLTGRDPTEAVSGNLGASVLQPHVDTVPGAGADRFSQRVLGTETVFIGSPIVGFERGCTSRSEVLLRAAWGGSNFSTTRQYAIWLVEALGVRCESSSGNVGEFTQLEQLPDLRLILHQLAEAIGVVPLPRQFAYWFAPCQRLRDAAALPPSVGRAAPTTRLSIY